jgi:predicted metal-dependent hydrolase
VIELKALNETWTVNYLPLASKTVKLMANLSHQLTLIGDLTHEARCLQKLRAWLQQKAKAVLYPQLVALAQETGLSFNQMVIRNNTTRWGSCSSEKNISLCCNLLFLPPHLVRHILLHELCHTKVLHHGPAFWRWLLKYDSAARLHTHQLREVKVPRWVKVKKQKLSSI